MKKTSQRGGTGGDGNKPNQRVQELDPLNPSSQTYVNISGVYEVASLYFPIISKSEWLM